MNLKKLRPGQQQALDIINARLRNGDDRTSIVLPTRYGKSDVIRLASIEAHEQNLCGCSLALSPFSLLRNQLVRTDKLYEFVTRYDIDENIIQNFTAWIGAFEEIYHRCRIFISSTIQLPTQNISVATDLAKYVLRITGKPLLVHIDECHQVSDEKARGRLVNALIESGAQIILYTATPIRADGELIPGFETTTLNTRDKLRYYPVEEKEDKPRHIKKYSQEQELIKLVAHHETTFQDAWNEDPPSICKLSRLTITAPCAEVTTGGNKKLFCLSECDEATARKALGKATRHKDVIDEGARLLVDKLIILQSQQPNTAAIVFTGDDKKDDDEDNRHAKLIKAAIQTKGLEYDKRINCKIITMKSTEGESAAGEIEDFVNGKDDVLIVKQMGGAGLDSPRIKVILDLSSVRTVASVIQRIMRVATPWGTSQNGHVITMADPMMNNLWKTFVAGLGGDITGSWRTVDETFVEEYPKEKSDDKRSTITVLGGEQKGFDDSEGRIGNMENWALVNDRQHRFPQLANMFSEALLEVFLTAPIQHHDRPKSNPFNEPAHIRCKTLRGLADAKCSELIEHIAPYKRVPDEVYQQARIDITNEAKTFAGIPVGPKLSSCTDPEKLSLYLAFIDGRLDDEIDKGRNK